MKFFLILLISIFFFSCHLKEKETAAAPAPYPIATEKKKKENRQTGDTIQMNFSNEKGFYTGEGSLDSIRSKVFIKFKNKDLGALEARIVPTTGKGNIRFNQIIFPDKSSDGPFGMDLKIPLKQKGDYILVIGHSLMADNPYWGKFKVQLENKKE
ncbi:hypothetical protein DR871_012615 [Flavobacterium petrolei]|uniref:Uncharacterized protein n=1 Tax=Flavobacterium petrolei TaxID=2259594 RepID=A0A482TGB0_9FLAO|nr:hypothetical protein [Flavobacterium petrolei]RYJ51271.1 hypothetical protein DR871_012615 [Flavobacterium petrolei]